MGEVHRKSKMKEITDISFNKDSRTFDIHLYDDDEGSWQKLRCENFDELLDIAQYDMDKLDLNTLDLEDMAAIRKSLKFNSELSSNYISQQLKEIDSKSEEETNNKTGSDSYVEHWDDTRVFYVTDIHLDSKISKIYGKHANDNEIESVIETAVNNIVADYNSAPSKHKIMLIGGDVSHVCQRTKIFYQKLTECIPGKNIMAILGNHEYWDEKTRESNPDNIELTSEFYEKMFNELYISFANNMLFTYKNGRRYFVRDNELMDASPEEIRTFIEDSPLTILGGTGFSGRNETYNCTSGMYRNAIRSRQKEKELSTKFESLYNKILKAVPNSRILIFTHMPMRDWTDKAPNPKWIYVNGHTHRNYLDLSDCSHVYSDNQIGYGGTVHLKSFFMGREHDIFKYWPNGIHEITKDQYQQFYKSKCMTMTCNREGSYFMIKCDPLYCFFYRKKNKLQILDGGRILDASEHDLQYYFNNMTRYGEAVNSFLNDYQVELKSISSFVKSIGGTGRMHGCIVDVDFYNHVYLNPFDGTITSYRADDMVNKIVFPGFEAMLESERRDLLPEYKSKIAQNNDDMHALIKNNTGSEMYYDGTEIYGISRIFYSLQHLTENFVVRRWDDALIDETDGDKQKSAILKLLDYESERL